MQLVHASLSWCSKGPPPCAQSKQRMAVAASDQALTWSTRPGPALCLGHSTYPRPHIPDRLIGQSLTRSGTWQGGVPFWGNLNRPHFDAPAKSGYSEVPFSFTWLWSKFGTANRGNPGKWKHGPKPAVPCWCNFDPFPHGDSQPSAPSRVLHVRGAGSAAWAAAAASRPGPAATRPAPGSADRPVASQAVLS